jgi:glutamate-5-semialdehyde dehydrogenase
MNKEELTEAVRKAKRAAGRLSGMTEDQKNAVLGHLADALEKNMARLIEDNRKDMERADSVYHLPESMKARLLLDEKTIRSMAEGVRQVMALPDPVHRIVSDRMLHSGLELVQETVPFGIVAMIYESRPNVTIDAAALCIKSGNGCILRGGKEAHYTNAALTEVIHEALTESGVSSDAVFSVLDPDHAHVTELLHMRSLIDLVIPRGSSRLIHAVVTNSTVPVIETGSGVCHTYIDEEADLEKAIPIVINAKVQRPSACNAMETLLVHRSHAEWCAKELLPELAKQGVEIRADETIHALYPESMAAVPEDWATEYNALILSVKTVDSLDEALEHIARYSTHHSECIITENEAHARRFMNEVDAACVYHNASTRFTDGFEFGFGAEIGISTQKMHVRGPMGLEALVTTKYKLFGHGEVRG